MVTSMVADDEGLFSIQEAADYLKVSYKTVYRWVRQHKLEAQRAGVQWRIPRHELTKNIEPSSGDRAGKGYNEDLKL